MAFNCLDWRFKALRNAPLHILTPKFRNSVADITGPLAAFNLIKDNLL